LTRPGGPALSAEPSDLHGKAALSLEGGSLVFDVLRTAGLDGKQWPPRRFKS